MKTNKGFKLNNKEIEVLNLIKKKWNFKFPQRYRAPKAPELN